MALAIHRRSEAEQSVIDAQSRRIEELEEANKTLVEALTTARKAFVEVTSENEQLHDEVQKARAESAALRQQLAAAALSSTTSASPPANNPNASFAPMFISAAAEAEQNKEMLRLTQEEASALKAEVEILTRRLHEANHNTEVAESVVMERVRQVQALAESLSQAQAALRSVEQERAAAESEVSRLAARISAAEREVLASNAREQTLQAQNAFLESQMKDYKTAIEELAKQASVSCAILMLDKRKRNAQKALRPCGLAALLPCLLINNCRVSLASIPISISISVVFFCSQKQKRCWGD